MHLPHPTRPLTVIGSGIGQCGRIIGCEHAPEVILHALAGQAVQHAIRPDSHLLYYRGDAHDLNAQQAYFTQIAQLTEQTLAHHQFPLLLGGDHACAIGTWSGASHYLQTHKNAPLSLIWVDAHLDAHRPDTSPSGNLHGMPVAHLLGHGAQALCEILSHTPKLKPEYLVYFGIRSFETPELELLTKLGVKIYYQHELTPQRFQANFTAEYARLVNATGQVGISLDLDGLDATEIIAVGTPEGEGIGIHSFLNTLKNCDLTSLLAFEIAEYNPQLDTYRHSLQFIIELIKVLNHGI